MSATVGASLKKIAVSLLTDKNVLKVVGGIVLGILQGEKKRRRHRAADCAKIRQIGA